MPAHYIRLSRVFSLARTTLATGVVIEKFPQVVILPGSFLRENSRCLSER